MMRLSTLAAFLLLLAAGLSGAAATGQAETAPLNAAAAKLDAWDTSPAGRSTAMGTIRDAGVDALPHIRALLKSKIWLARRDAIVLAADVKAPDLPEIIAAALKDRNWAVRELAASKAAAVAPGERDKVRPGLDAALGDRIVRVRLAAYATLVKWEPESKAITDALDDPDPDVAYWAARNYMERNRLDKLPPGARERLAESIISKFSGRRWRDMDTKGVTTLLALGPDARDALCGAIASESDSVRNSAVSKLGSIAGAAGVDLMFRFVSDRNRDVRQTAIRNISSYCGKKHAPRLLEMLTSSADPSLRHQIMSALGRLKYKEAVPHLLDIAGQQDESYRNSAFRALAEMGDKSIAPKLIDLYKREAQPWQRRQMIEPIARLLRHDAAGFLREALRDEDQSVRSQALHSVRSLLKEEDRGAILIETVRNDEDDYVRQTAITNLPPAQAAKTVDLLIEVLKGGGPQSRRAAAGALAPSGSARAVKAIVAAFDTEQDPGVRESMLHALAQAQAKQAVPVLKKALTAADPRMRAAALNALSRFDKALDNDLLVRVMKTEEDAAVLAACIRLISRSNIRDPRLLPRLAKLAQSDEPGLRRNVIECVARINEPAAVKILCKAIKNENEETIRRAALEAVIERLGRGKLSAEALAGPLSEALETEDAALRQRIVSALATRPNTGFGPLLLHVLKNDTGAQVRLAAARAVEQIADKQMVPQLIEAATAEERTDTLVVLIGALGKTGDRRALPFFRDSLRAGEAPVQAAALRAIGAFHDASLVPFYVERYKLSTSVEVRLTSLRNIKGAADRRTVEALLSALSDEDPRIRAAALDAAADFRDAAVAAALADKLCSKDVRERAARVIIQALGETRLRAVADKLLVAARTAEHEPSLRRIYAALGKTGDRRAIRILAAGIRKEMSDEVTAAAVSALAELNAHDQAGLCLDVARRSTGALSRLAAAAAARLGGNESFAYLAERFRAAGDSEKRFYAPLLAEAGGAKADGLIREALAAARDDALAGSLCAALTARSPDNVKAAGEVAVGDVGPRAADAAVAFLGKCTSSPATPVLAAAAGTGHPARVRAAALLQLSRVLTRLEARPARMPSIELARNFIDSAEPELKLAAVEAFGMHGYASDAEQLVPLAKQSGDGRLRAAAVRALGAMPGSKEAEAALLALLEGQDGVPLVDVVRALGELRAAAAAANLATLAGSAGPELRETALAALGRIGTGDALEAVEKAFEQKDVDRARAAAALALGSTGNQSYVPRLADASSTAPGIDVRAACVRALGKLGGDGARAALVAALKQDSGVVRESAVRALAAMKGAPAAADLRPMLKDNDVHVAAAAREALAASEK
ncbi:MAG: HEAT repeat domain-containing protein [Planctomycetota bacterium]